MEKSNVDEITGDFIGNNDYYDYVQGGAILNNRANIKTITGDFIGNYVFTNKELGLQYYAKGGAITNVDDTTIDLIRGNFVANYAQGSTSKTYGGAIANIHSTIKKIQGDFTGNYVYVSGDDNGVVRAHPDDYIGGGAIYNITYDASTAIIGSNSQDDYAIEGNFIGNYVDNTNKNYLNNVAPASVGGAIFNLKSTIGNIKGDYIGNYVLGYRGNVEGGAINNNRGTIGNIYGNFYSNYVKDICSENSGYFTQGGAIYNNNNNSKIGDITANFTNNYAISTYKDTKGGAIFNATTASIGNIKGLFGSNYVETKYGANAHGGAVVNLNFSSIGDISAIFVDNKAIGSNIVQGGAIYNDANANIGKINSTFVKNSLQSNSGNYLQGGAIFNTANIGEITSDFISNSIEGSTDSHAQGGAIYNSGMIGTNDEGIVNSNFINNYIKAGEGKGAAIYTDSDLKITAINNGISEFTNNTVEDNSGIRNEAIYADTNATVSVSAKNNGTIVFNDKINGSSGYKLNFDGDSSGKIYLNNDILDANAAIQNVNLSLSREDIFNTSNLSFNSGVVSTINDKIGIIAPQSFVLGQDTKVLVDVDLASEKMDRIETEVYGDHKGNLIVSGMNLISDAPNNVNSIEIYFAQKGLKDNVISKVDTIPGKYQTKVYTPIYSYNIGYDNRNDGGYFVFTRGGGSDGGNASNSFNPAVLASPVATQAAGQSAMNETFRYVFEHADAFTQLPAMDRFSMKNNNRYAIASTDYNRNSYYDLTDLHNKGVWVRPYTSFESINLKNGPKVDTINYGTIVGADSDFKHLGKGWANVATVYMGYNGSQMHYTGVSSTMSGGVLGLTETFYKGNFWTALTASAGAGVVESHTMYGKESSTMLMAGIGSKTGYNFEFKEGRFILQPVMFMSYTFVNSFDYTNAAGVRINSDPMHTFQINPGFRFIANTKNGWQPYAQVGMVWNLLNETDAVANGVKLPQMHTKPYIEYGVGIQKRIKDSFTAFGQAMLRNGGRNGIALTAGFRWALGQDYSQNDKEQVNNSEKHERKVLKQLSDTQKTVLNTNKAIAITLAKPMIKKSN